MVGLSEATRTKESNKGLCFPLPGHAGLDYRSEVWWKAGSQCGPCVLPSVENR
jgi:hypothetical protein